MAQKKNKTKEPVYGKKEPVKKTSVYSKYKNTIWTVIVLVILLIFFIINNTKDEPSEGPLPPNYSAPN